MNWWYCEFSYCHMFIFYWSRDLPRPGVSPISTWWGRPRVSSFVRGPTALNRFYAFLCQRNVRSVRQCWTVETWATTPNCSNWRTVQNSPRHPKTWSGSWSCTVTASFLWQLPRFQGLQHSRSTKQCLVFEVTISYHKSWGSCSFSGFAWSLCFNHPMLSNCLLFCSW